MIKELEYLLSPLGILKGFGEKTIAIYKKLLISNRIFDQTEPKVIDLIYHKPERVQYRIENPSLITVQDGEYITVKVGIDTIEKPFRYNQPLKIICSNETGFITVVYFGRIPDFLMKYFEIGNEITISGKIERFNNALQMTHPDYVNNFNIPKFEQVYPLTYGLSNRVLRQSIQNVLKNLPNLPEWIDNNFLFEHQWKSWKDSIIGLHNITEDEEKNIFVERLAFDELLANQIALGLIREKLKVKTDKVSLENKEQKLKKFFLKKLPFELTNDQKKVISEIENDIYSHKRMLRLLHGDVGSGKTVVAFLTMLPFLENRKQVVLMVPTSVLATQHYELMKKMCEDSDFNIVSEENTLNSVESPISSLAETPFATPVKDSIIFPHVKDSIMSPSVKGGKGDFSSIENNSSLLNDDFSSATNKSVPQTKSKIKIALLTGKIKGKKREKILEELKNGEIDILIGTHAIFQDNVEFKDLGYVIIDEQHRFGVVQRLNIIEKGKNTDVLIMTATPIPRTLALTIYGDMEVSTIKEKPKNRKEIITSSVQKESFNDLICRIKEKTSKGEKVYWICPLIEESEDLPATPLYQRYEEFKNIFDEKELGFIHGKLSEDEKDKIMEDFENRDGNVKILISTTVIEVGIDVPDATIIVIENPERFGLSQMHQLRGRVGRGEKQSYCILFYEKPTINLRKRMDILKSSSNGFFIAEEDLKMRGSGEMLGLRQSGFQEYLIADLMENYNLLLEASKIARDIIENKELLSSQPIKILLEMFGYSECLNEAILN
ncbi:MAG: ATP-dependent DNA helicase RecG [Rickettsiales bacterium]|nr:ATP-dependent DNA helicase RecG [Rickettsiales bacterium]